jgi:hypothetical protein
LQCTVTHDLMFQDGEREKRYLPGLLENKPMMVCRLTDLLSSVPSVSFLFCVCWPWFIDSFLLYWIFSVFCINLFRFFNRKNFLWLMWFLIKGFFRIIFSSFYSNSSKDYDNCYSFASFYGLASLWICNSIPLCFASLWFEKVK